MQSIYGGKPGMLVGFWGKCLDRPNNSTLNGTLLQMWDCHGFDAQTWRIDIDPVYDYYRIVSRIYGGAIDDPGASNTAGTRVQYWARWSYYNAQQFQFSNFMIRGHGAKCLTVPNGSSTVAMYDCNGSAGQRWEYTLGNKLRSGNKCLEVQMTPVAGIFVNVNTCYFSYAQMWELGPGGTIRTPALPGRCLEVQDWNTGPGSRVYVLSSCSGGTNQRWGLRGRINHRFSPNNLVLDVRNQVNANGTAVQLWPFVGTAAQEWDYYP